MKKLFLLLAVAGCLTFTACNNNNQNADQNKANTEMQDEKPCCKEMTEEQKAEMELRKKAAEDWQNWENITDERKAELLNERKAAYDKMQEMKKEQEAKQAAFESQMQKWESLSLDEKKAAFDSMGCCGGCKKGEGQGCCKKGGDKGGCPKDAPKEGHGHHGDK